MPASVVRIAFSSKGFVSNQTVEFSIYDDLGNLTYQSYGNEWANTGVYYVDVTKQDLDTEFNLAIAKEINNSWQDSKLVIR